MGDYLLTLVDSMDAVAVSATWWFDVGARMDEHCMTRAKIHMTLLSSPSI